MKPKLKPLLNYGGQRKDLTAITARQLTLRPRGLVNCKDLSGVDAGPSG